VNGAPATLLLPALLLGLLSAATGTGAPRLSRAAQGRALRVACGHAADAAVQRRRRGDSQGRGAPGAAGAR